MCQLNYDELRTEAVPVGIFRGLNQDTKEVRENSGGKEDDPAPFAELTHGPFGGDGPRGLGCPTRELPSCSFSSFVRFSSSGDSRHGV